MLIVIVGPDGCGKTSVAEYLKQKLEEQERPVYLKAFRYGYLPSIFSIRQRLCRLFGVQIKNSRVHVPGDYLSGMRFKPNSLGKSLVIFLWNLFDFFLGKLGLLFRKKPEVTIFARYYYDFYYQRGYIHLPNFLVKLVQFFVPKPDIVFFLKRSPEAIFSQKPELTISEIKRENLVIEQQLSSLKCFQVISGEKGLEEVCRKALDIVLNTENFKSYK